MAEYKDLDRKLIKLCKQVVRMCTEAGEGHTSSALSAGHLVTALMYRLMRYDPKNPWHPGSDRLVLSEAQAVPIVYAAYCDIGGIVGVQSEASELRFNDALTYCAADSVLDGRPNPAIGMPFFDSAGGPAGQGASTAAGMALAGRLNGNDRRIFCICGDGESRQGQLAEALDFIIENNLTAVRLIFNCNAADGGDVSPQQSAEALGRKLEAFGFDVKTIDGHNWDEVFQALSAEPADKPLAVIARTVKGWSVSELQRPGSWGKVVPQDRLEAALGELDAKAAELGVAEMPDSDAVNLKEPLPVSRFAGGEAISTGPIAEALSAAALDKALEDKTLSTCKACGAALVGIGADERIVLLGPDANTSALAEMFKKAHRPRYFRAGSAEQNMITLAAGLSTAGRIPFAAGGGKALIRAYDQIAQAAITNANVKIIGSHSGISQAAEGPGRMALCDLAFMRAFAHAKRVDGQPAVRLFQPCDAVSAFALVETMANIDGMCYMRTHRMDVPFIYEENEEFTLDGYRHLIDGEDIAIVASGYMVHVAREAIKQLEEKAALSASLIDVYAMPLKTDEILQIGDDCRGQILVVEDNYTGGFADEITAAAAKSDLGVMVETMNIRKTPKSARTTEKILEMINLSAKDIAAKAQKMFDQSVA